MKSPWLSRTWCTCLGNLNATYTLPRGKVALAHHVSPIFLEPMPMYANYVCTAPKKVSTVCNGSRSSEDNCHQLEENSVLWETCQIDQGTSIKWKKQLICWQDDAACHERSQNLRMVLVLPVIIGQKEHNSKEVQGLAWEWIWASCMTK